MQKQMNEKRSTIALYLASFIWGSAFIAQKLLVDLNIPVFFMIAIRMSFAIILLPYIFISQIKYTINRNTFKRSFIMGIFLFLIFSLQTYGLKYIDSSISAFISSLYLIIIPIINTVFFKSKFTIYNFFSILLALIGIYCFNLREDSVFVWNLGVLLTILCAIVIALQLTYANHFVSQENSIAVATLQNLTCAGIAFTFTFIFESSFPVLWSNESIAAISYLGIFASLLAYNLLLFGQKYVKNIVTVGLILSLQPLFTILIAIPLLKEELTFYKIIGIICVLVAVLFHEYSIKQKKG